MKNPKVIIKGEVIESNAVLRNGSSSRNKKILDCSEDFELVDGNSFPWVKVKTSKNQEGYILGESIKAEVFVE